MPFKERTEPGEIARRVLISGPPNSFKTTSLLTWPRPIHIISCPGEKGWETIPVGVEGVHSYVWEIEDPTKVTSASVVAEVDKLILDILTGKKGPVTTLALDGLHKLYDWDYKQARMELEDAQLSDDMKDIRAYGNAQGGAYKHFLDRLHKMLASTVPYVVCTVWEDPEKDDPQDKSKNAPMHVFPALPGKIAKRIVGEFSTVVYAEVSSPVADLKGEVKGTWQIRPGGKVWGVGVKAPLDIAVKLPKSIPQDFPTLERLLKGEK